jgi:hypothetical protein
MTYTNPPADRTAEIRARLKVTSAIDYVADAQTIEDCRWLLDEHDRLTGDLTEERAEHFETKEAYAQTSNAGVTYLTRIDKLTAERDAAVARVEDLEGHLTDEGEARADYDRLIESLCRLIPEEYDGEDAAEAIVLRWAADAAKAIAERQTLLRNIDELTADNAGLTACLDLVREIHRPVNLRGVQVCNGCTPLDVLMQTMSGRGRGGVQYPCATARAIGETGGTDADPS